MPKDCASFTTHSTLNLKSSLLSVRFRLTAARFHTFAPRSRLWLMQWWERLVAGGAGEAREHGNQSGSLGRSWIATILLVSAACQLIITDETRETCEAHHTINMGRRLFALLVEMVHNWGVDRSSFTPSLPEIQKTARLDCSLVRSTTQPDTDSSVATVREPFCDKSFPETSPTTEDLAYRKKQIRRPRNCCYTRICSHHIR